ncbi:hypothetical protein BKA69DRAFT_1162997 [Paraphysoderma sedebokerense]|nr:hypothetical protein BKA69DRAFT_1162997 [Paraphysoderma sedebokerense]
MEDPGSIMALSNLLQSTQQIESFAPPKKAPESTKAKKKVDSGRLTKEIWDPCEVEEDEGSTDINDPRQLPEYDVILRQKVYTEDIYLGMNGKSPSFHDADEMVITVQLPATDLPEIELSVKELSVDVRTPKFRLSLPLQKEVHENKGKAHWDKIKAILTITLPIKKFWEQQIQS